MPLRGLQVSKIDSVGKEARLKAEQLTLKTQLIEDNLSHNVQVRGYSSARDEKLTNRADLDDLSL